jgi:hypothetical protein
MRNMKALGRRGFPPSPAIVVAFIALFVALGGFGYAAVKLKPNSVKTKNLKNAAVTQKKLADGSVTTAKLSPGAVAPNALRLGGVAPGGCHAGWLKASMVVDTSTLTPEQPAGVVPGFNCASKAADAVRIERTDVGRYTVTLAGIDSGVAISSSSGANAVTAASKIEGGVLTVRVWNNGDAQFVDGRTFSLIAF